MLKPQEKGKREKREQKKHGSVSKGGDRESRDWIWSYFRKIKLFQL